MFTPLLARWGFAIRIVARRGWWPLPDDVGHMTKRDFRAFTRSIGLDERVKAALAEDHEGTRKAHPDAGLSRQKSHPQRRETPVA